MKMEYEPKTPFEGAVITKLNSLCDSITEIKSGCVDERNRYDKINTRVSRMEGRASIFGVVGGVIGGFIKSFFFRNI